MRRIMGCDRIGQQIINGDFLQPRLLFVPGRCPLQLFEVFNQPANLNPASSSGAVVLDEAAVGGRHCVTRCKARFSAVLSACSR